MHVFLSKNLDVPANHIILAESQNLVVHYHILLMEEIRLVVYPIIYRFLINPRWFIRRISEPSTVLPERTFGMAEQLLKTRDVKRARFVSIFMGKL